jgi:glycosyltransferase involved in cell wall biosynthesis
MISAFLFLFLRKMRGEKFIAYTIDMDQFSFSLIPILCVPYFIELHDAKHKGVLFSRFFRNTSGVLTINNIIKNKLCERFNIPNDKVIVAPNGISEEFFNSEKISREDARKMLSMQNYGRVALYAGQFYAWKGLEIFTEVARLAPDIVLYLAGGSREQFEKITGIKNIPENLIFGGIRPYREMPILMRASDALLVLGTKRDEYSYYHTSPMKLFEYLPIGRPIVAAGTPAVKDMVSEREVFFYEPDNAQSFADTIRRAIAEGNGAHQISGARVLAEKYTWASRAQKVISYLAQRAK